MNHLTINQTRDFLNKGILEVNNTYVTLYNCHDDFIIDKVYDLGNNIRFVVSRLKYEEPRNISYKEIETIGGMKIDDIINAYVFDDEDVIQIEDETDVINDVIGKPFAVLGNYTLTDGMKIILKNDKTEKMNNKTLSVKYSENTGLKLSGQRGRPKKSS